MPNNKIINKKIQLPFKIKSSVLALGSQAKNTLCFAKGNNAYLSRVHSDLTNPKDYVNFIKDVQYFFKEQPKLIASDLHPEYVSTKYAKELNEKLKKPLRFIQHHHAHIASCMLDNKLKNQKVIGVAFDGTGLGENSDIWGAEFFLSDYKSFKRYATLTKIPLLGGEAAILEPWRVSCFWLNSVYKDKFLKLNIPFTKRINKDKWRILKQMYSLNLNSPLASSAGRLFDAAAAIILNKQRARFEADLAIALEKTAGKYRGAAKSFDFNIKKEKGLYVLDPGPMFKGIVLDIKKKESSQRIAYKFHLTVATMIYKICLLLSKKKGIKKVVLSGGVFQNKLLLKMALDLLYKEGLKVFIHKDVKTTDVGLSLGQAVIASF